MLKKLSQQSKIKQDFERYRIAIEKIQNQKVKKQFEIYLRNFQQQINLIDEGHSSYNNGYIHPKRNRDNVERLVELRTKLETLF
jgi:hypothetical protein